MLRRGTRTETVAMVENLSLNEEREVLASYDWGALWQHKLRGTIGAPAHFLVNCSWESDMATRVVLDHSGDSRHVFDRVNAEAILRAETVSNDLTAKELCGGGTDGGPRGHTTRKVRSAYGRDAVQPAPGRRLLDRTLANRRHPLRYG